MNISKFLLIDAVLVIASIPILFFFKGKNSKSSIFYSSNKERLWENASNKFPDKETLLELERRARQQGSGIEFDSLVGNWKFISVWMKNKIDEDFIFSSLLRIFAANIDLEKDSSTENPNKLCISVSIQFGLLSIKFSGNGFLEGKQPLLTFFFNLIEFKTGSSILFSKPIEEKERNERSFFALIALERNVAWLSARGQNGALILWYKV